MTKRIVFTAPPNWFDLWWPIVVIPTLAAIIYVCTM